MRQNQYAWMERGRACIRNLFGFVRHREESQKRVEGLVLGVVVSSVAEIEMLQPAPTCGCRRNNEKKKKRIPAILWG